MERKAVSAAWSKADDGSGIVEHIVAVTGNIDLGNDRITPGAFTKTLAERGPKIRVLDQHNTDSVLRVLGKPIEMRELGQAELPAELLAAYPDATGALWCKTQFLMDTPEGAGAYQRLKAGALNEWSIGFDPLDVSFEPAVVNGKKTNIRTIRTVKLYEYSPVLWGMNPATTTLNVKSVVPFQDLPLADQAMAWDASAAEGRVREWAGGDDTDWAKYRRAFVWYDGGNAETFGAYKLQIADVIDGTLTAVPRGVFAAAGAVQGARGGVDIPDAELAGVKSHLGRYYAKLDMTPPWEKTMRKELQAGEPVQRLVDTLAASVLGTTLSTLTWWLQSGYLSRDQFTAAVAGAEQAADTIIGALPAELADIVIEPFPLDDYLMMMAEAGPTVTKVGRVLSKRNESDLRSAAELILAVLSQVRGAEEDGKDGEDKPKDEDKQASDAVPETTAEVGPSDDTHLDEETTLRTYLDIAQTELALLLEVS